MLYNHKIVIEINEIAELIIKRFNKMWRQSSSLLAQVPLASQLSIEKALFVDSCAIIRALVAASGRRA
ncbi:MAG: hypothetical protein IPM82_30445 [Saprospiraceae bacterium]|nr:hypothetical protein [Saprospiraceae bacterium]